MREIILYCLIALTIPAIWRRPFLGLIIYLGANVLRPEMLFWGGTTGSRIFIFYYGLFVFAAYFNGYFVRFKEVKQKEIVLMLWMLSAIFLSILFSQYHVDRDYYFAFEIAKTIGICIFICMLAMDFKDIQRLQSALLVCFTLLGFWGILQQTQGNERLEGLGGNAWGDSNGVAAMYVLFLPVALTRAFNSENRRDRWISFGMATVMVILIICTKSRGGFLGLIVCLFCYGFYTRQTLRVVKIAVIIAICVAPFVTDSYIERLKTMETTDTENVESSARSRLILWQAGLMVFADNPLFGTGFMTYPEAKMKYEGKFLYLEDSFREAVFRKVNKKVTHSTYIQMLSDCGIAGGLPFILLIYGGIKTGFWARRRLRELPDNNQLLCVCGLCAGLTGFAVCMITIDMVLTIFMYVQLVCIGILSRMTEPNDHQDIFHETLSIGAERGK